jgi:hypothetical protein
VGNGGGSGNFVVTCGTPLNVRIEDNKIKWEAPDVSTYTDYITSFKYYISVNGGEVTETTETFYSLNGYADGDITIQLYALLFVTTTDQSDTVTTVLAFVFQGTYARLDDLSVARYMCIGVGTPNNFAVFAGGFSSFETDAYNMNLSGAKTALDVTLNRQCHNAAAARNFVLVGGGYNGNFIYTVICYDMENGGTRSQLGNMSVGRGKHGAAGFLNYVAFAGGTYLSAGTRTATADMYNSDNAFAKTVLPNMSIAKECLSGAGANGFLVFGGGSDGTNQRAEVEAYSASDNIKTALANLGSARRSLACASANNFIVFAGGFTTNTGRGGQVDAYDMANGGVHTTLISILSAADASAAGSSGSVIIAGGTNSSTTYANTVTRYDMQQSGLKTSLQVMLNGKYNVGAAGTEKYVVLAGGYSNVPYPETEAYNIAAS